MKRNLISAVIIAVVLSAGCMRPALPPLDDPEITVLKKESWIDLMPVSEGKVYINLELSAGNIDTADFILQEIVLHGNNEKFTLSEKEFNAETEPADEFLQFRITANFIPYEKELTTLSAELKFLNSGEEFSYLVDSIKVDKVY